ncbi:MAG: electron transfer flavoprotein subunit beta/FixA family protein [Planctomycetota bacterium]|jgi:electron transfer flavoprotein beta subunit
MDTVVLVKRVPDPEARVAVSGTELEVEEKFVMGLFDEIALAWALQWKEAVGGTVTVLTVDDPGGDEILRKGIALGADKAIRVEIASGSHDPLVRARALAGAVKKCGAGLVLCGKQSGDEEAGFTGPAVASLLGLPCVCGVLSLEATATGGKGRREIEGGWEAFEAAWPAVITAGRGLAEPGVPQIMGVMKAMKAPVEVWSGADVSEGTGEAVFAEPRFQAPPKRGKVRIIEGEAGDAARALIKILREEAKAL